MCSTLVLAIWGRPPKKESKHTKVGYRYRLTQPVSITQPGHLVPEPRLAICGPKVSDHAIKVVHLGAAPCSQKFEEQT